MFELSFSTCDDAFAVPVDGTTRRPNVDTPSPIAQLEKSFNNDCLARWVEFMVRGGGVDSSPHLFDKIRWSRR